MSDLDVVSFVSFYSLISSTYTPRLSPCFLNSLYLRHFFLKNDPKEWNINYKFSIFASYDETAYENVLQKY